MRRPVSAAAAVCLLGSLAWTVGGGIAAAGAQDNPMLGSWSVMDAGTGQNEVLTVTSEEFTFGSAEPPISYRFEKNGDGLAVYFGEAKEPANFTAIDAMNAQLSVPGGPIIALQRNAPLPIAQQLKSSKPVTTLSPSSSAVDAVTDALLPHGVETPYEPLEKSLDAMLEEGWQLDQASGTHNNFTMLLSNGGRQALCIMVPRNLGQADTALVDCRRLN